MELDVHILVMEYTKEDVVSRCLESVKRAAAAAPFTVNIHPVVGVYGHMGASRATGYAKGKGQYVTHVDDDDWIEDNAFSILPLEAGHESITTGETMVVRGGIRFPDPERRHHLAVFKRSWLEAQPFESYKFFPDQFLLAQTTPHHIPECVYNHVVEGASGSRKLRSEHPDAQRLEFESIRRPELFMAEALTTKDIDLLIEMELQNQ